MIRDLQSFIVNVDAQNKAKIDMKRGTFVKKDVVKKELTLANDLEGICIVDRDNLVTDKVAMGLPVSDYDEAQELIKAGTFGVTIPLQNGIRKATSEYDGAEADFEAGKFLTVSNGKLIASVDKTIIKSLGYFQDNGHKLVAFEIVK